MSEGGAGCRIAMQTYRFGEFELDLEGQQLFMRGQPVRLERRAWNLLVVLIEHRGRLVGRDELIRSLWPPRVIIDFDSGLNTLVRKVRHAIGDSPNQPRFIETVPGRGYRFIAPVDIAAPLDIAGATGQAAERRPRTGYRSAALAVLLLAIAGLATTWMARDAVPRHTRIAVLPFENLTGIEELSYLASGLAEDTSVSLARIDLDNLAVIGGVSARALAGSTVPAQQIGSKLDIDFVVQSSLRLDGSRIRVTSRLIRIADGVQLWSASFDRELTNVLGLQRELSIAIAEQVRQRLSPEVAALIDRRQTQNPEAYELYLKGRYAWSLFLPGSVPQALQYYRQAVLKDPTYALAWAGIAHALVTSPVTAGANPQAVVSQAQDALQRALEYGSDLAEVQLALGSFHFFLDWDFPAAEAAARDAVALDPNSAMAHMFLGITLAHQGKHVEAAAMLRRARELDPLFPLMFANSATVALTAGDPPSAIEFAKQAIAINPEFWVGYLHLGRAELALGHYDDALSAFAEVEKLSDGKSVIAAASSACTLARLGRTDEARDRLAELVARDSRQYVAPYHYARIYAALGEREQALEWLERSLAVHDTNLLGIGIETCLDTLRADRRFESIVRRSGAVVQ